MAEDRKELVGGARPGRKKIFNLLPVISACGRDPPYFFIFLNLKLAGSLVTPAVVS